MENNWTIAQTKELFEEADKAVSGGGGLSSVFAALAKNTGRKPNSVRNYYYSQSKLFSLIPDIAEKMGIKPVKRLAKSQFETFNQDEIESVVRAILIGKAQRKSVRAVIWDLSGGDPKRALRLQNKYRSLVVHRKDVIRRVMDKLSAEGASYFNPYAGAVSAGGVNDNPASRLKEIIARFEESEAAAFLNLLKKLL